MHLFVCVCVTNKKRNFFFKEELKKHNIDEFYHACKGLHTLMGRQAFQINLVYTQYIITACMQTHARTHTQFEQRATDDNHDFSLLCAMCLLVSYS